MEEPTAVPMRASIFRVLESFIWWLCVTLDYNGDWYDGSGAWFNRLSERCYVLSGALELAADGEKFEWPTDWEV